MGYPSASPKCQPQVPVNRFGNANIKFIPRLASCCTFRWSIVLNERAFVLLLDTHRPSACARTAGAEYESENQAISRMPGVDNVVIMTMLTLPWQLAFWRCGCAG